MEIEGNVFKVGAVQSGTSKAGNPYTTQEVVVEFFEFPTDMWTQKIVLQLKGHSIEDYHLNVGDKVKVRFGLNINEWKGRFFQEVRLAQDGLQIISRLGQKEPDANAKATVAQATAQASTPAPQQPATQMQTQPTEQADDLPF